MDGREGVMLVEPTSASDGVHHNPQPLKGTGTRSTFENGGPVK